MKGSVIVLNGTSSSGKTTLAKAIQSMDSEIYLHCCLDAFWDMTPPNIPASSITFPNIKLALSKTVKALVETGHNVVLDIIFSGQNTYHELKQELNGVNLLMVKVDCPLEELKQREMARGDRKAGLAESQYESIHEGVVYYLIVNTFSQSTKECARSILDRT